jgi:hypothetical protein
VLAALQGEVGDSYKRREFKKWDSGPSSKTTSKSPLPLPAPPLRDKQSLPQPIVDRRGVEATRASSSMEAKAAALRSYRRALGLCYKCNERWNKDHKCAPTVQLQAVQQLWELLQPEDEGSEPSIISEASGDQLFFTIPKSALTGSSAPRTIKLIAFIQDQVVSILIDCGSTNSFVSEPLATRLTNVAVLPVSSAVQVAGGRTLHCATILQNDRWSVDDCVFYTDLRVLSLTAYDVVIGMD